MILYKVLYCDYDDDGDDVDKTTTYDTVVIIIILFLFLFLPAALIQCFTAPSSLSSLRPTSTRASTPGGTCTVGTLVFTARAILALNVTILEFLLDYFFLNIPVQV